MELEHEEATGNVQEAYLMNGRRYIGWQKANECMTEEKAKEKWEAAAKVPG